MRAVYLKDKNGNKLVSVPYYRVGDLFLTTIATNPSSYLGGKWELFGPGRCLVCVDTSQSEFNSVKKTGGEKTHKLTTNEMPTHNHVIHGNTDIGAAAGSGYWHFPTAVEGWAYGDYKDLYPNSSGTNTNGGNQSHNNLQPFITCYVWIRTA